MMPCLSRFRLLPVLVLSVFLVTLSVGCAQRASGRFDFQLAVNELFESGRILANHTYYHIGPDAEPDAIMALDNAYHLAPSLWKKSDITPERLAAWMERIDNRYRVSNIYHGAFIVDDQGRQLGVWYSRLTRTVIRREEGNMVTIFTPDTTRGLDNRGPRDFWGIP